MKREKRTYVVSVSFTETEKNIFESELPDDESMAAFVRKLAREGLAARLEKENK